MSLAQREDQRIRLLKAISHPLRQQILVALNEGVASPNQLSKRFDQPLPNVSYHVKILLDYGAIELVDTAPRRGAIEHFYRAIARPYIEDDHWAELPISTRRALFDQTLQQIWEHVTEASEGGGLDDPRSHISWTTLELDASGYEELSELLNQTIQRALELQAEAAGRLNELEASDREAQRTELVMMHFHRPGPPKGAKGRRRGARR